MSKVAQNASRSLLQRFKAREIPPRLASGDIPSAANPFLPRLSKATGQWRPPKYSLRRQADLIKEAKRQGSLHVLPPGPKNPLTPTTIIPKRPATASPILSLLNPSPIRTLEASEASATKLVNWIGAPKARTTFGLYGKRRNMFKGHKWEKQSKLRKAYMERVVAQVDSQKSNMRYVSDGSHRSVLCSPTCLAGARPTCQTSKIEIPYLSLPSFWPGCHTILWSRHTLMMTRFTLIGIASAPFVQE